MRGNLISEDFGKLEERLEQLQTLASMNDQAVISAGNYNHTYTEVLREIRGEVAELQEKVFERVLNSKSIDARDFLNKIVKHLIDESRDLGLDIAISVHGKGRVPMHLIEIALSSILACVKLSVESFRKQSGVDRIIKNLFPTCSFQLEIAASTSEMHFKILHDGEAFSSDAVGAWTETVRAIRENVARAGGWFSFHGLDSYGGRVEFKIPVARTRHSGFILRSGSFEMIVPSSCVAETFQELEAAKIIDGNGMFYYGERAIVCFLTADQGVEPIDKLSISRLEGAKAVLLGAADFQFMVLCDDFQVINKVRAVDDRDLLDSGAWFRKFGVFQEGATSRLLPMMDGGVLVNFHKQIGSKV